MSRISKILQRIIVEMIVGYQKYISPRFPGCCRYTPTCSAYGLEAVRVHGPFKGTLLALWRICRCNPFSKGGYDPVPPKKEKRD